MTCRRDATQACRDLPGLACGFLLSAHVSGLRRGGKSSGAAWQDGAWHLSPCPAVLAVRLDSVRPHVRPLLAGVIAVSLMIFWAADDGGFDATTWYWGALVILGTLAAVVVVSGTRGTRVSRETAVALTCFALYVLWSYLSMTWAQYPGAALEGSNRALLYLLIFTLFAVLPWTPRTALAMLLVFAGGIGVIAFVLLFRFTLGANVSALFFYGRLASPTGYINSTAALFTIGALTSIALAAWRELPGAIRGLLITCACADLQVALTVQSRGWLFTLPLVALATIAVVGDRLRTVAAATIAVAGTLVPIRKLLHVYQLSDRAMLRRAAIDAGKIGLLSCAGVFMVATLLAWAEQVRGRPPLALSRRRVLGAIAALMAVAGAGAGLLEVSGGHPAHFISRQWNGFSKDTETGGGGNHFAVVGSGRYDFWRVSLDAFLAHPIGGLGQDNFGDYYLTHRRTSEEPKWTHSLEMRLLTHTGIAGFALFAAFIVAALRAALRTRRSADPPRRMLAGAALMALVVWLIYGSLDWFWEFPSLSGPALGFLAMAGRLGDESARPALAAAEPRRPGARPVIWAAGALALLAGTVVLGLPFLAARELSLGETASRTNANAALADLNRSHQLNPLSSDPGTVGGTVALVNGRYADARNRFSQAISKEPGAWFAWLGRGLSASALGDRRAAQRNFQRAVTLNNRQVAVRDAAARVMTARPLSVSAALKEVDFLP
jgi:hypothetical protein